MKAKLIYIVSAGHSGSTLLDIITGTLPGVFSTGELTYLPWQMFRKESAGPAASLQKLCSCSNGFHECNVWSEIIHQLSIKKKFDIYLDPFRFKINILQNERYFSRKLSIERILRGIYIIAVNHKIYPILYLYKKSLKKQISNNWLLYDTICEETKNEFIVDSSKSVYRLYQLYAQRPSDIFILFLMRDIRAVSYSEMKLGNSPIAAAKGWVRQYDRIFRTLQLMDNANVLPIWYEQYSTNPSEERLKIAEFIGKPNLRKNFYINTVEHHLVAGNGLRHKGLIAIKIDEAWKTNLPHSVAIQIDNIKSNFYAKWKLFIKKQEFVHFSFTSFLKKALIDT